MNGLYEVATWLAYAAAAAVMLAATAAAVLAGLALRLAAEFLRGLVGADREEGDARHGDDGPRTREPRDRSG